jgi:hypothetical protein
MLDCHAIYIPEVHWSLVEDLVTDPGPVLARLLPFAHGDPPPLDASSSEGEGNAR